MTPESTVIRSFHSMSRLIDVVYPGSFDPPTLGHLDVIERALKIFNSVTVLIAESTRKTALFTPEERKELLEKCFSNQKNIFIKTHSGLTVDYAQKAGAKVIIRGLRAVGDFEYEFQMATMNRKLHPEIETLTIMTGEKYYYISSNTVKEVAIHGGDISQMVPPHVVTAVQKKLKRGK